MYVPQILQILFYVYGHKSLPFCPAARPTPGYDTTRALQTPTATAATKYTPCRPHPGRSCVSACRRVPHRVPIPTRDGRRSLTPQRPTGQLPEGRTSPTHSNMQTGFDIDNRPNGLTASIRPPNRFRRQSVDSEPHIKDAGRARPCASAEVAGESRVRRSCSPPSTLQPVRALESAGRSAVGALVPCGAPVATAL